MDVEETAKASRVSAIEDKTNQLLCDQNCDTLIDQFAQNAMLEDLPDEILENIFYRLSPYNDIESIKCVSKRFYAIAKRIILNKISDFEQSLVTGHAICEVYSAKYNDAGKLVLPGSWATERFGHMACYYDKSVYILGGTTNTPTTFNDMWKFDLSSETWSRCVASGHFPTPKALASCVQYKDNLVVFGGWSHPPPFPLMQPWRVFDELHIYNFTSNRWSLVATGMPSSPLPSAGHSASIIADKMLIFGGRTFNQCAQSYPLSNSAWIYDFALEEWLVVMVDANTELPTPRYGQTQVSVDDENILIIGGCDGPNKIFSDVWLLNISFVSPNHCVGKWSKILTEGSSEVSMKDFPFNGCKVGNSVIFFERTDPISPFLAFLHFECQPISQDQYEFLASEGSRQRFSGPKYPAQLRRNSTATMAIYSLDISKVIDDKVAKWVKENKSQELRRPSERQLYSMVVGRAELILFGGFYKDPLSSRCRVSNDIFIVKPTYKCY